MKNQILITVALSIAQCAIAMEPRAPGIVSYEPHAEGYIAQPTLDYQLYSAAQRGDYNEAARALEAGANVNAIAEYSDPILGDYNESILAAGVKQGHREVVQLLVENGANMNLPDEIGMTPILIAASKGGEELVMLLLTTPNRNMIESAFAAFNAIQRTQKPTKDIRYLLKRQFITQLVQDQMNRIAPALTSDPTVISSLMQTEIGHSNPDVVALFDPQNTLAYARIRQRVEENISRLIFGEPRQPLEPAQGLTQEELDDIMGRWER